jgi:hypothetical protein
MIIDVETTINYIGWYSWYELKFYFLTVILFSCSLAVLHW